MKDPREEQWLNKEAVTWHCESDVPLSQIDWEESLRNQARLKVPLIENHVDELCLAILSGTQLPDPIGYYNKEQRIVIISGNHRTMAYRRINDLNLGKIEKIDWYIVSTYPWKIDYLTRTSNVIEGVPLSAEDRLEQAKYLVNALNYTPPDAARSLAISVRTVNESIEIDKIKERLVKVNFTPKLPMTTLMKLYRIKQDKALLETIKLVQEAVLTSEETAEVAKKVERAANSEMQQANIITRLREEYKDRITRTKRGEMKQQMIPTIKFTKAINAINATRPETVKPLEPTLKRKTNQAIKEARGGHSECQHLLK